MSIEQRKSVRMPVSAERQKGELRFGKDRFPVQVADQSADGFAVMAYQTPCEELGAKGLLRVGKDWYDVSLCNSTLLTFPISQNNCLSDDSEDEIISNLDVEEHVFRIGLHRLGDAYDPDAKRGHLSWAIFSPAQPLSAPRSTLGLGLLFAILVVALPLTAAIIIYQLKGNSAEDVARIGKTIGANPSPKGITAGEFKDVKPLKLPVREVEKAVSDSIPSSTIEQLASTPLNYLKELREMINRMPGASGFLLPNVIQHLQLSPEQQSQIQGILDKTALAIEEINNNFMNESDQFREKLSREVYDISRESALKLLTIEQRELWTKISAGKSDAGPNKQKSSKK